MNKTQFWEDELSCHLACSESLENGADILGDDDFVHVLVDYEIVWGQVTPDYKGFEFVEAQTYYVAPHF